MSGTRLVVAVLMIGAIGCASSKSSSGVDASPGGDGGNTDCNGLPCSAIYVTAAGGNDSNAGTKDAPVASIAVGVTKAAQAEPHAAVFVAAGTYAESITMVGGVSIYGGFDATWTRGTEVTEIDGGIVAVRFDAIMQPTILDGLTITSANATGFGESTIAVLITGSKMIQLDNVVVTPGTGGPGMPGSNGSAGAPGDPGQTGTPGCEDSSGFCSSCGQPQGAAGGTSPCGRTGGRGG
ncbi:MAG: DUF1565 domain-containing protein, partial [Deltaproteobacteria bacterium]|nr:DUF1565 domain-containing protein [Deltaproteobacteria bacterium]